MDAMLFSFYFFKNFILENTSMNSTNFTNEICAIRFKNELFLNHVHVFFSIFVDYPKQNCPNY